MPMDRRTELANSVAIGKDGWLFHRDNSVFEQMSGAKSLTDAEVRTWVDLLVGHQQWLSERNIEFRFFIAPEKHVVYRDHLPEGSVISERRPAMQVIRALRNSTPIDPVYPDEELMDERVSRETYHAVGTHWNFFGGFLAYRQLAREIAKRVDIPILDIGEITFLESWIHAGDLGVRLDPEPETPEHRCCVSFSKSKLLFGSTNYDRGHVAIYENLDVTLPKAVIFRDSSFTWILPFLSESFSRIVAVGTPHLYYDLIEREKPDIVILEMIERWVGPPQESPAFIVKKTPLQELSGLSVDEIASKTGLIIGYVDSPAPKSEVRAPFDVSGWAVSSKGIEEVGIYLDGCFLGNAGIGTSRPDLARFPCVDAETSGFHFRLDAIAWKIPEGRHQLVVHAVSRDGIRQKLCDISITIVP
jgi:alginate O-acetyltransferase complex protein AlgJ